MRIGTICDVAEIIGGKSDAVVVLVVIMMEVEIGDVGQGVIGMR